MIDLYTWSTPNGWKASIMLEELALDYRVHAINIMADDQFSTEFMAINPNSKIPAIVDPDGPDGPDGKPVSVFESGAILMYLAEKTGSALLPVDMRARYQVIEWLMFQVAGVGPMFGQAHHFLFRPKTDVPYGQKRYHDETRRLYGVMDGKLAQSRYLAGDDYSIADIATYPWVARFERHQVDLAEFPSVNRWYDELSGRPAVIKGMAVPSE